MQKFLTLAIGGAFAIACTQSADPTAATNGSATGGGALSQSGIVYGFTAAPDSQRFAIGGAIVSLSRMGDLPGGGGIDSSLVDPGSPQPPCEEAADAPSTTTAADGSWTVNGLEEGIYRVAVVPPATSQWGGVAYCGLEMRRGRSEPLTLYLAQ